jgi:hypothetical protein
MDHIDEALTTNSLDLKFEPSICAALGIAKKTLNKYYNATDQSDVYQIAMGTFPSIIFLATDMLALIYLQFTNNLILQSSTLVTNFNILSARAGSQNGSKPLRI